jgi:hypothetical protein
MWVLQIEGLYGKPKLLTIKDQKVHNTHINKLVYAIRGHLMKMGNIIYTSIIIYKYNIQVTRLQK